MASKNCLITLLLILASCSAALGQAQSQYDKGTPPQLAAGVSSMGSYISTELGTVNLSNGGLNINIPLGTVGGRGNVAMPLALSYSSKVWSASIDVDTERESGTEQSVAYADYDMGSSLGGGPLVPGWTLGLGMQLSSNFVRIKRIMSGPSAGCYTYGLHKLTLRLPDKGEIEFRDDATNGAPLLLNCQTQQTASRGTRWHATDGSGTIFINAVDNGVGLHPSPNLSGTIIFADGTRFGSTTNGALVDRNGNRLSYTSNGYLDQLGRNITIQSNVTDPDDPGVTLAFLITIPGYQGTSRYYKLKTGIMNQHYRSDINPTLPVINGDWDPEGWGYNWGTATRLFFKSYGLYAQRIDDRDVLTEVALPDGRSLKFKYNEFGEVAEIELPTGAKIRYDYGYSSSLPSGNSPSWETGTNGSGSGIVSDVKFVDRAVQTKRTYPDGVNLEGTWSFSYGSKSIGGVNYPCTTVTVNSNASVLLSKQRHIFLQGGRYTEPYNSQSVHDGTHYTLWSTGVEWRTETLDAAGNVLAATEQDWTQRAPVSWSSYPQEQPANDNRVNQTRRYLETGMMAKVETFYDQYNNPIEVKEYDYDQTLKRRTVTTYLSTHNGTNYQTNDAIHLLRLPESQTIFDGNGNQVAKTVTEYDVYADHGNRALLLSYASVSQHDANYGTNKITRGNPTRIGTWLNTTNTFIYTYPRYDILGNVVALKDARGNVSTVSFADDFGNGSNPGTPSQNPATPTYALPTLITSPPPVPGAPAHTARSQYDYSTGLLTGFRDRNNVVTQTIYNDPFNRPTLVKAALGLAGLESHAAMYYAPATTPWGITLANNDVLTARDQTALDDANLRSWTVTDGFGRTKEAWTRDPQGDVKLVTNYDALGRTKQVSNPFRSGQTPEYSETTYDLLGRVTAVTTPDGAVVSSAYQANTVTVTDQAAKQRKSVTDALGRLTAVYENPNGWNYLTSYSYDTLDNLITVNQDAQTRTFSYNSLKQLTSATNPESGTVTYKYDDAGNVIVRTDARGVSTHYAYDAFNRVTRRWYNSSSATTSTTHNNPALPSEVGASNEANFFYNAQSLPQGAPNFTRGAANGRLVAVTYGTNSTNGDYLGYDAAGRNVLKIQRTGNVDYQTSVTLNIASTPTAMVYPSGHVVNYSYDVAGRTASVTGTLGDGAIRNYATELSYSVWGGLAKEKFGTSNAVYHKLHYNVRGQLFDVRASNVNDEWGGELGALANYYSSNLVHGGSGADNNGNVLRSQTIINSFFIEDRYTYDALNRLTSVSEYKNGTEHTGLQEYDYDRYGNRTIKLTSTGTGINSKQFIVNPANNRLGVPSGQSGVMAYDAAGNLKHDTYTGAGNRNYDAENKITSAWGGNNQAQLYGYDASGQRIKRTVDGVETWHVYGLGGELLAEYPAGGAASIPRKEYCYRNGQLLVTAEPAPSSAANVNVAAAANGGVATASSNYPTVVPSYVINGDHVGSAWWADNTSNTYPDWVQVEFPGSKTISEIDVFGLQQNYSSPVEPTLTMTSSYALTNFEVQYWNGSAWATVPEGNVTGNNKVWRRFTFPALTTNKIRVHVTHVAGDNRSQVVEIEAYGPPNVALAANGAVATASSTYPTVVPGNVNNGDHVGSTWWADNTSNAYPDWIQVEFAGAKTIAEIDIFGLQQNLSNPVEPTATMTSSYALTDFEVQYWTGSTWTTVPGGSISGNNKVWRKLTFAPLTTTKIRVHVTNVAGDNRSQVVEIEAYAPANEAVLQWLVADHLGTPRMIIDRTGTLANIKRHDYLPFGEELFAPSGGRSTALGYASGDGIRQQFTSKERDIETGLDYFGARYYSSTQGRFTGVDPVFISTARMYDPQRINLFAHARNNPLKYIDPKGEDLILANNTAQERGRANIDARLRADERANIQIVGNKVLVKDPKAIDLSRATNAYRGLVAVISNPNVTVNYYGLKPGESEKSRLPATETTGQIVSEFTYDYVRNRGGLTVSYEYTDGTMIYDSYVAVGDNITVDGLDGAPVPMPETMVLYHEAIGHSRFDNLATIQFENLVRQDTGVPQLPLRSGFDHDSVVVRPPPETLTTTTVNPDDTYLIIRPVKRPE